MAGCAPIADAIDAMSNGTAEDRTLAPGPAARALHDRLLVADLHADTLLWRRAISPTEMRRGHVDLVRMERGNIGLQAFTIPTRVPTGSACISGRGPDPAGLLATLNGWPPETRTSAHHRALHQASTLAAAAAASRKGSGARLSIIQSVDDLRAWLSARFPVPGTINRDEIGVILGLEGSHALNDTVGAELDALYRLGLRLIAPTHRFDNAFGGSSEGCDRYGLTMPLGKRLIETAIARRMIVDLAHASSGTLEAAVAIATSHRHPVVISHSGLRSFLERLPPCCNGEPMRGNTDAELVAVAQTGGVFGIGFWKEVLGTADVDYIVAAIRHALAVLEAHEGRPPPAPGLRTIKRASQHIGLGSDWDGAVRTAIDAGQVGLITEGLMAAGISQDRIADIMGRNVCRVVAQSLAGGSLTFDQALQLCNGG
ncbi:dipeptidase [Vineibacter terrae]|uniref:dipeptidase n=1 Tax=Vineibacter terrae TaxID=2586908 RepID=UPI002E359A1F|nr:membrane dipeptidase [Vineibacter terrae]HEX2886903.1 membrane dipeptidase [Vineibacter terrae]